MSILIELAHVETRW